MFYKGKLKNLIEKNFIVVEKISIHFDHYNLINKK